MMSDENQWISLKKYQAVLVREWLISCARVHSKLCGAYFWMMKHHMRFDNSCGNTS